jgi:polysaccharide biosynthesis/export protein
VHARVRRLEARSLRLTLAAFTLAALGAGTPGALAQESSAAPPAQKDDTAVPREEFAIGADDVIGILVWGEKEFTGDLIVRPDGFITVPLLNDVSAAGKTPSQLKSELEELLKAYIKTPNVTVTVKQINSRKVSITGKVFKAGAYPLLTPMRALDLIALAGGLTPAADARHLSLLRTERGARVYLPIDYADLSRGIRVWQDIVLRPGDVLIVP